MMSKLIKPTLYCSLASILALTSCQPTEEVEVTDVSLAENDAFAESIDMALENEIDYVSFGLPEGNKAEGERFGDRGRGLSDCATVTQSGEEYPKTITIDFGEGCEGPHGHVKTGQVIIELSDVLSNAGATRSVTLVEVTVDGRAVSGSRTTTNQGMNEDGHWVVSRSSSMTITDDEVGTLTRTHEGSREWIAGFGPENEEAPVFYISGSGSIITPEGTTYTKTILSPILVDRTCRFPMEGIVEMTRDAETATLDFGSGECDDVATVTVDGTSEEITLTKAQMRRRIRRNN